jgi:pimeloyl-ACP methyl ester carboxylesterase
MVSAVSRRLAAPDGTELRVLQRDGDPERPGFLLVHGLASNARLWDGVADELAARGDASVAVDQRAHGESEGTDDGFDFGTLADDLAAVVDATLGRPVVAAGQSWGGNVVLELAARHPELVEGVVCVDGGFITLSERFPTWEEAARVLAPPSFEGRTVDQLRLGARVRFEGWPESGIEGQLANFVIEDDGAVRPRLTRPRHMAILAELYGHHPRAVASGIEVPVRVIAVRDEGRPGSESQVERFVEALPRGSLRWMEGHHDVHAQQPEAVAADLVSFAEGIRG